MPFVTALAFLFSRVALVDTPSLEFNNRYVAPATGPLTAMTLFNEFGSALMELFHVPIDEEPLVWLIGGGGFQPLSWDWTSMIGLLISLFYFVMLCCWLASASSLAQSSASAASELTTVSTFDTPALPTFSSVLTGLFSSSSDLPSLSSSSSIFIDYFTPAPPFRSQSWDSEEAVPLSFPFMLQLPSFAQDYPASAGLRTMSAYNHYIDMQRRVNNFADGLEHHLVNEMLPFPPTPSFAISRAITIVPFYVYTSAYRQYADIAPEMNEFADDMERRYAELFPSPSTTITA